MNDETETSAAPAAPAVFTEERLQRWRSALLSGKYKQAKGALNRVTTHPGTENRIGFCCLGVLLDAEGCVWRQEDGSNLATPFDAEGRELNNHGDEYPISPVINYHASMSLAILNDDRDYSFEKIAEFLDSQEGRALIGAPQKPMVEVPAHE